jgi:diaminopimelate epimerase
MNQLTKYHALGNDYLVLEPQEGGQPPAPSEIERICHRNFGPGSDGILFGPLPESEGFGLRIFNPDGSEAEKSGNGLRIFARYLFDTGRVKDEPFSVQTLGGKVQCVVDNPRWVRVEMGKLNFLSSALPATGPVREIIQEPLEIAGESLLINCASIGNPHCVVVEETVTPDRARKLGPHLEHHPLFPQRTNVQFLQVLDRNRIRIEIWERGAGYTLASGSSSCAAAGVAHRLGLCDEQITVEMPGGKIEIEIEEGFLMKMAGPVQAIGSFQLNPEIFR